MRYGTGSEFTQARFAAWLRQAPLVPVVKTTTDADKLYVGVEQGADSSDHGHLHER